MQVAAARAQLAGEESRRTQAIDAMRALHAQLQEQRQRQRYCLTWTELQLQRMVPNAAADVRCGTRRPEAMAHGDHDLRLLLAEAEDVAGARCAGL
jgi:hypothetical protein